MEYPRLQVNNLGTHQLGPYTIEVNRGECVSLSGPSGSGKSLLLRAIADLDVHDGQVLMDNVSCEDMPAPQWRKKVTLVPVESQWWQDVVGSHFDSDNCPYLEPLGFNKSTLNWQVSRLSTGEKQRLALARALMNQPVVLLLDEPTASLDRDATQTVEKLIASYREETGAAVIWVSHDDRQAARVGSRHYLLRSNQLVETANVENTRQEETT
ncbi:ABC transporter ATP-binding protein [Kaarinaea lacus]